MARQLAPSAGVWGLAPTLPNYIDRGSIAGNVPAGSGGPLPLVAGPLACPAASATKIGDGMGYVRHGGGATGEPILGSRAWIAACRRPLRTTLIGMTTGRPSIPAELERAVFVESGYRCTIPGCAETSSLEIDHIVEWSTVKEHKFDNLIVLCPNHHAQKTSATGPRMLDRKALQAIKHNLARLNGRYGDTERRVIDYFVEHPTESSVELPPSMQVLMMRLTGDGLVVGPHPLGGIRLGAAVVVAKSERYDLTERGGEVVARIRERSAVD